ncbi:unnamed protein product [Rhizophagus irregularis]|nr:unnamed protein product [Rhizophagus irregularis]
MTLLPHKQLIHGQLGSILTKLDGMSSPPSVTEPATDDNTYSNPDGQQSGGYSRTLFLADGSDRIRININSGSHLPISFPFHISPSSYSNDLTSFNILRLGSLNVCSLVSSTKQLNLFSILLSHALHAMYIIKKKFYSDQLIGLLLQLPGKRDVLLIGGYIPPLDYIWTSPSFSIPFLWASVFRFIDNFPTDHFLIIVHFDFLALHSQRAPSYMKQRQRSRTCFDYYSVNLEQKEAFTTEVSLLCQFRPPTLLLIP